MASARGASSRGGSPAERNVRELTAGGVLLMAAFVSLAVFDRPLGGILFLAGVSLLLDARGQFHPAFALLFPLLALMGGVADAARGLPGAALRWSLGAGVLFALGRVLRRHLLGARIAPNPGLETLTAELTALKAMRDRGEMTEAEFAVRRDAAVTAIRDASPGPSPTPDPAKLPRAADPDRESP